jgi:hypothetical protein
VIRVGDTIEIETEAPPVAEESRDLPAALCQEK